jgi:hypothetical protein
MVVDFRWPAMLIQFERLLLPPTCFSEVHPDSIKVVRVLSGPPAQCRYWFQVDPPQCSQLVLYFGRHFSVHRPPEQSAFLQSAERLRKHFRLM